MVVDHLLGPELTHEGGTLVVRGGRDDAHPGQEGLGELEEDDADPTGRTDDEERALSGLGEAEPVHDGLPGRERRQRQ